MRRVLQSEFLFLLTCLNFRDSCARILDRISKLSCGVAEDRVTVTIKNSNLVAASYQSFSTFLVKDDGVVRPVPIVCNYVFGATLIERLDDFCGLRASTARRVSTSGKVTAPI